MARLIPSGALVLPLWVGLLVVPDPVPAQPLAVGVNVRDFGAQGDGTTDDTAPIREAFQAAAARSISEQPVPGMAYVTSLATVYLRDLPEPMRRYEVPEAGFRSRGLSLKEVRGLSRTDRCRAA